MTLETYLENQRERLAAAPRHRGFCSQCRLSKTTCDCAKLTPFATATEFILLMHPEESRRRIATGRLTHLILKTSHLVVGESFEANPLLTTLLEDPSRECAVLFPGPQSIEVETWAQKTKSASSKPRTRTIFVLDGTWRTAKKMLRLTPTLAGLPRISFIPPRPSRFRIRKQPFDYCFSTLEAVHHLLGVFEPELHERHHLLDIFDGMVERQIRYAKRPRKAATPFLRQTQEKELAPFLASR